MRVAIVQKDLKNLRSGVARIVLSELHAVSEQGGDAILICERLNRSIFKMPGVRVIKVIRWPFKGYFRRKFFEYQANFWIRRLNADVSVAHGDVADVDLCFIHNCVHLEHELLYKKPLPAGHDVGRIHAEVLTKKRFKKLICNSNVTREDVTQRYAMKDRPVEILYPSRDPSVCSEGCGSEPLKAQLGISRDDIVLGLITSGNFKKRNVAFLIEMTSKLHSDKNLHIVVAGNGKRSDYIGLAEQHPHQIHFLPTTDDVATYYRLLDVFVLPAVVEEFGMSALEAMSCGLPVVLHNMVGASEILEGLSRDCVIENLSLENWVPVLQGLIADAELRAALGVQNEKTAKKYSNASQEQKFLSLLAELR
jgi:UDP-glucose:(heptosyl)LPS alpha-1,3-glucosyltransferase